MIGQARRVAVVLNKPMHQAFTYAWDAEAMPDLAVGSLVAVPFGNREEVGCVVELDPAIDLKEKLFNLRAITRRASPDYALTPELIALARWISEYYFCSLGEALATVSVIGFSDLDASEPRELRVTQTFDDASLTERQRAALVALRLVPDASYASAAAIARAAGCTASIAQKLVAAGALVEVTGALPTLNPTVPRDAELDLTIAQQEAIAAIRAAISENRFETFLLHGVTGSGKTEVYLQCILSCLQNSKTALCLVPEIALTPQTVERFERRFQMPIGVFHSQLTREEKLRLYRRINAGLIRLVIGARSACFAPLPNLGLIIVDEEHEGSYKQGETPRYHARDTALVRASRLSIPVVLGSATPSLESWENARRGKYRLLSLKQRPAGLQMPTVRIVPLAEAAATEPTGLGMLSEDLKSAIRQRLAAGEQSLLFLNRRGFSNFLMCSSCRWVCRCVDDDIVMTIHRRGAARTRGPVPEEDIFSGPLTPEESLLKCHFCGITRGVPKVCPECGSEKLVALGTGTQRVEEAIRDAFPDARLLRLDQDTVGGRRAFLEAWQKMVSGEAQIILGTQMLAKGLHLERVTLVGVILADIGLFMPDFRAEERTFSLLMQVSGRAGRISPGEVLIQTYMPRHDAIRLAAAHDYEGFVAAEMKRRERLRFPPVERLIALTISDDDRARAQSACRELAGLLRKLIHRTEFLAVAVLGPQAAPVERLGGRFRQRLLLRATNIRAASAMLRLALADAHWRPSAKTNLTIDVDPLDLL